MDLNDRDYVLGTHDAEIARLGLQHAVWRPRALDAWRRAGLTRGQRVIDFGAGPGFASFDLADVVGPGGEVVATERSSRFLAHLRQAAAARGLANIRGLEVDLNSDRLGVGGADAAWCRWIFAFLTRPRAALERLAAALKPGSAIVIHEYLDYATQRLTPRVASFEAFTAAVMASWRAEGGEPDIGLELPAWLETLGFRIECLRPIVDVVDATNFVWQWPTAFFEIGCNRLVEIGRISEADARIMRSDFARAWADPSSRLVTPLVLEIIARKP